MDLLKRNIKSFVHTNGIAEFESACTLKKRLSMKSVITWFGGSTGVLLKT